jgi:hypothetical protein
MEAANMVRKVKAPWRHIFRVATHKALTLDHVGADPLGDVLHRGICTLSGWRIAGWRIAGWRIADGCTKSKRRHVQGEESAVMRISRAI